MRGIASFVRHIGPAALFAVGVWSAAQPALADRSAAILAINDVYRIEGVDRGNRGGLARVRALREELEERHGKGSVVLLHAGDLLFPSLLSRAYSGEQMVDLLNVLDGVDAPDSIDERLVVVLGNHEFDAGDDPALLRSRIAESQFRWLGTNVRFAPSFDPEGALREKLVPRVLIDAGGLRIGVFGITTDVARPAYVEGFLSPEHTARRETRRLREQGADVVVALTHLAAAADRRLLEALGADGPDLIVGGHDHEEMVEWLDGRPFLKASSDARSASVIELYASAAGALQILHGFRSLGESVPPDVATQKRVDGWLARHERDFCAAEHEAPGCLDERLASFEGVLEGEEALIRSRESSLGSWVADRMRESFAHCGARAAFLNSGSLRLNENLSGEIRRRDLETLLAYDQALRLVEIDGATLREVLRRSAREWPGSGHWLQVSGLAFRHDPRTGEVSDLTLLEPEPHAVRDDERVRAVTLDFLVDPEGSQDGYRMLGPDQLVGDCEPRHARLHELVRAALAAGVELPDKGRICQSDEEPCLAVAPPRDAERGSSLGWLSALPKQLWQLAGSETERLHKATVVAIALLLAFLTVVQVWQIPPTSTRLTRSHLESEAPKQGTGAGSGPPAAGFAALRSNFASTVLTGLGGVVSVVVLEGFWGISSFGEGKAAKANAQAFYVVWFVVFFLLFLFASAFLRASFEALRSRLAVPHRSPERTWRGHWQAPRRFWSWLLSMRRTALVFFDTGFNVIQGRNQLQTAALGDTILDLQRSIRAAADSLRAEIERCTELAVEKASGVRLSDPRAVRVSISVLAGDGKSVRYVSRSEGSLLRSFPKKSVAWVSVASGEARWWKESYLGCDVALMEGDPLPLPVPVDVKRLMLDEFFEERASYDYKAFIILPIPWYARGVEPPVRKGGIHISFRKAAYLDALVDGSLDGVEPLEGGELKPHYERWRALLEEPEPGARDPDRPYVREERLRAALRSGMGALTELLRYYNEEILELERRSAPDT